MRFLVLTSLPGGEAVFAGGSLDVSQNPTAGGAALLGSETLEGTRAKLPGEALEPPTYGASCTGIRPNKMRRLRRLHGSVVKVRCGGASLTCRLAIGGKAHEEFDPQVLTPNPPLKMILEAVWDDVRSREKVVFAWRAATEHDSFVSTRDPWTSIAGPVSAAYAHLCDLEASWPRPFTLNLLDHDINILHMHTRGGWTDVA